MNKLYSDLLDWILTSQANKQAINSRALGLLLLQLTVHFHSTNLLKLKTECFGKRRIKPLAPVKGCRVGKCSSRWHDGNPAGLPLEGSLSGSLLTVRVKDNKEDSRNAYHAFHWWSLITLSLPGLLLGISPPTRQRPSPQGPMGVTGMAAGDSIIGNPWCGVDKGNVRFSESSFWEKASGRRSCLTWGYQPMKNMTSVG